MGWCGHRMFYCPKGKERINIVIQEEGLNWEDEFRKVEVLKSALRGTRIWFAIRCTIKKTGETYVMATLAMTNYDPRQCWFYIKMVDETCGPCYYDCPKSILDMLSEPRNEWSKNWREGCEEARKKLKLSDLPFGTVIELHDRDHIRLMVFKTYTGLRWYVNEEKHYRMTAKSVNACGWHVVEMHK